MNDFEIQSRTRQRRLAVMGDFCLDIYWHAYMRKSELSRETPHFPLPIVQERMSPGGAGNVAANILALKPASLQCIGLFGDDWRGREYLRILGAIGADTGTIITDASRRTDTYIKPLRQGLSDVVYEDPRLDFSNSAHPSPETEQRLLAALDGLQCDLLCVCDQMPYGCITQAIRDRICRLGQEGLPILVDSRDRIGLYRHVMVKPNELEASRALGMEGPHDIPELQLMATRLSRITGRPAIVTAGDRGCTCADGDVAAHIPAVRLEGEIDICGAGDTFMAAFACAYSSGATLNEAAALGCRASAVTVKKLHTTGTACWDEI